jgi:uridine phosphorylase
LNEPIAPILEFDPDTNSILNPQIYGMKSPLPATGVMCFFQDVIKRLLKQKKLEKIGFFKSELGKLPVYKCMFKGQKVFAVQAGLGAPFSAGILERLIARGAKNVVVCGGCGVLQNQLAVGHLIILEGAIRDEGTSYHYLPYSREVQAHPIMINALVKVLKKRNYPYLIGKSWTTDASFRETPGKRKSRLDEGCLVVEMEAAALFAVAQFRKIAIGEIVYCGDLVVPEGWDEREWIKRTDVRENLFWLSVEAACSSGVTCR